MNRQTMKYLITGGTGFIGSYLRQILLKEGHFITIITRNPAKYSGERANNQQFISWDDDIIKAVDEADAVINLAGENIFGFRWTDRVKKKIRNSRIQTTRKIVQAIDQSDEKPDVFISASGVNYYKSRGDQVIDESGQPGEDFLAQVCVDWESEARKALDLGVRTAIPRIAPALQDGGGMIEKMKLPFLFFAGGPLGSGKQYVPWIHMDDLCRAILYPVHNQSFSGPYNACSPMQVTMNELARAIGKTMNRPSFMKVPEFAMGLVLGEAASPVLESLRILPAKLLDSGFEFEFEDLEEALADIL
jgi:uncharacterized protein